MRVLILGGTSEGAAIARAIAKRGAPNAVMSLAGRTRHPTPQPLPCRIGGFGGIDGLRAYLSAEKITAVLDATHPFAERISTNAAAACSAENIPLACLRRPPWQRQEGDLWHDVASLDDAPAALSDAPKRVFLTMGRLNLGLFRQKPQHFYLVRSIDPPAPEDLPPHHRIILARGPFSVADEITVMREEAIDILVSKNSGGPMDAKIAAARHLGIAVIMAMRPPAPENPTFEAVDGALNWLDHTVSR